MPRQITSGKICGSLGIECEIFNTFVKWPIIFIPSFIEGQENRIVEYPISSSSEIDKGGFSKKFIAALKVSFSKIYQFVKFEKYLN